MDKEHFWKNKDNITNTAFDEFNCTAFQGRLGKDVAVQWSKRLRTAAGLTRLTFSHNTTPGFPKQHTVIELSTKIVDNEENLRLTLLHELVHAVVWIFHGISSP